MWNKLWKLVAILIVSGIASEGFAQNVTEEANKQVAKLIGDAISARIAGAATSVTAPTLDSASQNEKNNIWGSVTRSRINITFGADSLSGNSNLYLGGYDREVTRDLIIGGALSHVSLSGVDAKVSGIDPYLAYRFTETLFAIGRVGYAHGTFPGGDLDIYSTGVSINAVARPGNAIAKGRFEVGTSNISIFVDGQGTFKASSVNFIGDGEVGYRFGGGFYGFAGVQVGTSNQSNSYRATARVGFEQTLGRSVTLFGKYEQNVDDNLPSGFKVYVKTVTLGVRARF